METNSDQQCLVHNKEKTLFCETESIWFCEVCIKNHKKCRIPLHYTEIIEIYTEEFQFNKPGTYDDSVFAIIKKLTDSKNELIDLFDNYISNLKDSMINSIELNNENKIQ
jgi:hypothetical protein